MIGIGGTPIAIAPSRTTATLPAMSARMYTARRISELMDDGSTIPRTETCGFRTRAPIGSTNKGVGPIWIITAGVGSATTRGAGLLSLRTVVSRELRLGLVSRSDRRALLLATRAGRVLRLGSAGVRLKLRIRLRQCRMGASGSVEAYHPWYGRGFGGIRNTAIVNNTNIASVYRNARVNGAVTGMRAGEFGRSAVGGSNFVRPSSADLSHVSMMSGGVPLAASRESRVFSAASGNFQGAPRTNQNTRFFSASSRATASPSSLGSAAPRGSAAGRISGGTSGGASAAGGWRRFDPSTSGASGFRNSGSAGATSGSGTVPGFRGFQNGGSQAGGFQRPSGSAFQSGESFSRGGENRFQGGSAGSSQAVRIAPPIVNNRSQGSAPRGSNGSSSGFGGPRPSYSAPRAPQGGGFRGAPGGGGGHSGGGHSGGGRR